jgi:hypothetical protein
MPILTGLFLKSVEREAQLSGNYVLPLSGCKFSIFLILLILFV